MMFAIFASSLFYNLQPKTTFSDVRPIPVTQSEVKEYVQEVFKQTPILISVAKCESTYRQFKNDNADQVLRGTIDKQDVGVMQINEHYQLASAQSLGYDIYTTEGNIAYSLYLYGKEGTAPWSASKFCWSK